MAFFVTAIVAAVDAIGTAAFIGLAVTAVADTGIALSVIGAVTGNKTISKVGGVLSLVGGIGEIAEGVIGAASAGSSVATDGSEFSGVTTDADGVVNSTAQTAPSFNDATNTYYNPTNTTIPDGQFAGITTDANGVVLNTTPQTDPSFNDATSTTSPGNPGAPVSQPGAPTLTPTNTPPVANQITSSVSTPTTTAQITSDATGSVKPPPDTSDSGIKQWWNNLDSKTQSTLLQAGAGLAGGAFNGWTESQKLAFQKQQYSTMMTNGSAVPKQTIAAWQPPATPTGGTGLLNSTQITPNT